MMIMAQHPQQHQQQQQQQPNHLQKPHVGTRTQLQQQKQQQQATTEALIQQQSQIETSDNPQQRFQLELDGKRTLIKNQLYLIEQLQLENATLRSENSALQLENDELKFQLQVISSSSSNILLNQSNATYNEQQLERFAANDEKSNGNHHASSNNANVAHTMGATKNQPTTNLQRNQSLQSHNHQHQVKLLATPQRQPAARQNSDSRQQLAMRDPSMEAHAASQQPSSITSSTASIDTTSSLNSGSGGKRLFSCAVKSIPLNLFSTVVSSDADKNARRCLPHDEEDHRAKLVELCYGGDSEQVQSAAIIIQRAFRKYQICKRFRTITEQLRHTHQPSGLTNGEREESGRKSPLNEIPNSSPDATRTAAWESLSYAASRLAASAAGALAAKQTLSVENNAKTKSTLLPQQQQQQQVSSQPLSAAAALSNQHLQQQQQHHQPQATARSIPMEGRHQKQQDPVVAAAINFQQLESIRKRQYRVGLNIFNKDPEKGVSFLVAHSFIDSSSPYMKTSTSYYHSNQLHFFDKQHFVHPQKNQQQLLPPADIQSCQLCFEEENLKRNIAHFLLHRKGLAKERIGQYLGNLQAQLNQDVLRYYLQELDFYGLQIDLALRKFLSTFRLPGEAQKIERIVDCFAQRYVQCQQQQMTTNAASAQLHNNQQQTQSKQSQNQTSIQAPQQQQQQQQQRIQNSIQTQNALNYKNNLILLSKDEIFILTFAIIMLNTDLHSPSLKPTSRMSAMQFVNNLRGVFKSQTINESDLIEIYERVKANQITTTPDHVTHVMKVQQGLTVTNFQKKELPNLCVPHRRLVCFCRLFEVYDVNKKERLGQHQREIFLFNDLLLVTKLARRVRANTTQLYTYRQSIPLLGLYVQLFQSPNYNFGIKLCQRSNDETLIMFNARNELDQSRFVDDLGESIAEMDEMETIKNNNIIETIHFKYLERLQRHTLMHNTDDNVQMAKQLYPKEENNPSSKLFNMKDNKCDTSITKNKQILALDEPQKQQTDCNTVKTISVNSTSNTTTSTATTTSATSTSSTTAFGGRMQTKFSSMLNLSSAASSRTIDMGDNNGRGHQTQTKDPRQNQLCVNQQSQRVINQSGGGGQDEQASGTRRGSVDSGLCDLSRDVSPNQSS